MQKKIEIPTEYEEACLFVDWLEIMKTQGKVIDYCHVANESYGGTRADMLRGAKMKRQGRKPGVFDYQVFVKTDSSLFLFGGKLIAIELKRQKGGTISPEQKYWQNIYETCGIPAKICKGAGEAISFVKEFI